MDTQLTWAALAIGVILAVGSSFGDAARKRSPFAWYAYVPWHAAAFLGVAMALFALVHIATLLRGGAELW